MGPTTGGYQCCGKPPIRFSSNTDLGNTEDSLNGQTYLFPRPQRNIFLFPTPNTV